jgi:hypothetical protein
VSSIDDLNLDDHVSVHTEIVKVMTEIPNSDHAIKKARPALDFGEKSP